MGQIMSASCKLIWLVVRITISVPSHSLLRREEDVTEAKPPFYICSRESIHSTLATKYGLTPEVDYGTSWKTGYKRVFLRSTRNVNTDYNYSVWARLVGPTIVAASVRPTY